MNSFTMKIFFGFAIIVFAFLFTVTPISAQNQSEISAEIETEIEEAINPVFPISPIIQTALSGEIAWHPEWPQAIPPDSFSLLQGKAASIQLEMNDETDEAEQTRETFLCEWNERGQLVQFPVFYGIANEIPFMTFVQFNESGNIEKIRLSGKREAENEKNAESENVDSAEIALETEIDAESNLDAETANEIIIEIEIMEMNDEEYSLARINRGGEYYFVVFQYWSNGDVQNPDWTNHVSETWYNADGTAAGLFVLDYANIRNARNFDEDSQTKTILLTKKSLYQTEENLVAYDYDSWGNISQVNAAAMNISVLYNDLSLPKYLKKTYREEYFNADTENNQSISLEESFAEHSFVPNPQDLTFQWDERNLLVSLKGNFAQNENRGDENRENGENADSPSEYAIAEKRYEYTLDDQKNWTERREIIMMRKGDYLFPSQGFTVRRTIEYIED